MYKTYLYLWLILGGLILVRVKFLKNQQKGAEGISNMILSCLDFREASTWIG